MISKRTWTRLFAAALGLAAGVASAQTTVQYGRITAVNLITEASGAAQTGGAILGGALGASSASNRSSSTRVLRGVAGGLAGQQVGRVATQRQTFEYSILIGGTSSITMRTDEAGLRVGDCVAVERGEFNNFGLSTIHAAHRARVRVQRRRLRLHLHRRRMYGWQNSASPRRTECSMPKPTKNSTVQSVRSGCSAPTDPTCDDRGQPLAVSIPRNNAR